jgi:class 3 adenylate cyclase
MAPHSSPAEIRDPEGERKQLTVLFADVQGSMELQEDLDVEAWAKIVDRFVNILADGVRRFGGTIDKFTGDGIMALFGAPEAQEDHARRACHAAWHMSRAIRAYAEELRQSEGVDLHVRVGLNSGEVVVGRVGQDLRIDPTALGHAVGLAQRMEALAVPGSTYLTERTARLVEGWFRLRDLGPMTVKGAREQMGVYVLAGPAPPAPGHGRRPGSSRMVGRTAEMAILEDALGRAAEGRAQVVGVVGEPGVGKSRLCDEFVRSILARGISVRRTAGVSHGREVPLLPILAYFRDYFGITEAISPSQARERISDRLLGLDASFLGDLTLFFDFLEVPNPERPAPLMAAEVRMRRIFEVLRRVTARRSERELAVLVWEDLHWFDPQSEAFLERLIENFPGSRTLVVANFRPEFSAAWMRHSYYRQIPLLPLSAEGVGEMLGELLGADPSLASLPAYLLERTGGNPFFVEEVVRALVEDGTLAGRPGEYVLTRSLEQTGLPASVQAVLAARIDRLSAAYKPVLQSAAVIGRTFSEPVLAKVESLEGEALEDALSALCAAELLQEVRRDPVAEYRFWHPLTQEVAYGTLLAGRRHRLHAAVARAIIETEPDRLDEHAALVAEHFARGDEALEAARWENRAAHWAQRNDLGEAVRRWQAAITHLGRLPESDETRTLGLQVRSQLLRCGARAGMAPVESQTLFEEGRRLAQCLADDAPAVLLLLARGTERFARGDLVEARTCWLESAQLATATGDSALQTVACTPPTVLCPYVGPIHEGFSFADQVAAHSEGDPDCGAAHYGFSPLVRVSLHRAELLALSGRPADASREANLAVRAARERHEAEHIVWTLCLCARLADLTGAEYNAADAAAEAVRVADEAGNVFVRPMALQARGIAALLAARPDSAAKDFSLARRQGARIVEILALLTRAQVVRTTKADADPGTARPDLDAALALVHETGAVAYEPFIREELGLLRGDESELREATRLYEGMGASGHAQRLAAELAGEASAQPSPRGSIGVEHQA